MRTPFESQINLWQKRTDHELVEVHSNDCVCHGLNSYYVCSKELNVSEIAMCVSHYRAQFECNGHNNHYVFLLQSLIDYIFIILCLFFHKALSKSIYLNSNDSVYFTTTPNLECS